MGTTNINDELDQLKLIDFGISSSYIKEDYLLREPRNDAEHIDMKYKSFKGNDAFCSRNVLSHKSTSRRDDLISLVYVMVFLITLEIPFMKKNI